MIIGAQFYSVKNYLTTNEGIAEAFRKTKQLGFDCLQYSGAPNGGDFDPEVLKPLIDKYNLPVKLTHIDFFRLLEETDAFIEKHKAIGCFNIGVGIVDKITRDDMVDERIAQLITIKDRIEQKGLKFFYHNHAIEFCRLKNGMRVMDYMIEKIPDLNVTLDLHWVQRAGCDVMKTIDELKGRLDCVHIKDYGVRADWSISFLPIGTGNMDYQSILPKLEDVGVKYAFVEQDDASTYDDPFGQLAISMNNIKKWRA